MYSVVIEKALQKVYVLPGVELADKDLVAGVTGGMLLVSGAGVFASGDSGILLFSR